MEHWEAYLDNSSDAMANTTKNGLRHIGDLSRKYIGKQYQRVVTQGRQITQSTPDLTLHSLRIQCKYLRYMFEFFSSLLAEKKVTALIKRLKNLQDYLGDFNDLCQQQKRLNVYISRFDPPINANTNTHAAIGGLIGALFRRQQEVRATSQTACKEFCRTGKVKL
jgi:CHAD domain-containing protein